MKLILKLPGEVRRLVLSEWLTITDLGHLDIALCNGALRHDYMFTIHNDPPLQKGVIPMSNRGVTTFDVVNYLKWISDRCILIQEIRFTNHVTEEFQVLFANKAMCVWLQYANLEGVDSLTDDMLFALITQCPHLKELNLSYCIHLTDEFPLVRLGDAPVYAEKEGEEVEEEETTPCFPIIELRPNEDGHQPIEFLSPLDHNYRHTHQLTHTHHVIMPSIHTINTPLTSSDELIPRAKSHLYVKQLPPLHELRNLSLNGCSLFTDNGINALLGHTPHLAKLNLRACIHLSDHSLTSIATNCLFLEELDLSLCRKITDTGLNTIASTLFKTLISINLYYCRLVTDNSISTLASKCQGLKNLNLAGCHKITDSSLLSLAQNCPYLTHLNLSTCLKITDEAFPTLTKACKQLNNLNLSYCRNITDYSMRCIFENCGQLLSLNIKECAQITSAAFMMLKPSSRQLVSPSNEPTSLSQGTTLTIQEFNMDYCGAIEEHAVILLVQSCPKLRNLLMTGCPQISYPAIMNMTNINHDLHISIEHE